MSANRTLPLVKDLLEYQTQTHEFNSVPELWAHVDERMEITRAAIAALQPRVRAAKKRKEKRRQEKAARMQVSGVPLAPLATGSSDGTSKAPA